MSVTQDIAMLMTQAEYARHRKVARSYITQLIASQKIPQSAFVFKGNRRLIDVAAADHALGINVERVIARDEPEDDIAGADSLMPSPGGQLTKAKTATEVYRAKIARLEFEQRILQLIPRDHVVEAVRACGDTLVRFMDQMVVHADEVAAAVNQDGVAGARRVLRSIIHEIRNRLADEMRDLPKRIVAKASEANSAEIEKPETKGAA